KKSLAENGSGFGGGIAAVPAGSESGAKRQSRCALAHRTWPWTQIRKLGRNTFTGGESSTVALGATDGDRRTEGNQRSRDACSSGAGWSDGASRSRTRGSG